MQIDSGAIIFDVYGEAIPKKAEDGTDKDPWTLGDLIATAFLTPLKGDEQVTSIDEKLEAYRFAKTFAGSKSVVEVSPEDLVKIRKRVAKAFHTMMAGPALELLDKRD